MELFRRMEPFSLFVMFVGALDWGILGLFNTNVLSELFGPGDGLSVAYTVIGLAALISLPRLLEMLHMDTHRPRAHRA
ncbi:MAG: DUF378 domain-containing protein [Solirubrobacteraceae bacterium]